MRKYIILALVSILLATTAFGAITAFPNGVSSYGIPVIGTTGLITTGKVWFVSSSNVLLGANGGDGTSLRPFQTIDYTVGRCVAGRGDLILVMPSHTEQIVTRGVALASNQTGLELDVSGVRVVGLGKGDERPQLSIGVAGIGAQIGISATDVTLENIIFNCYLDALEEGISIEATGSDATIKNCEFRGTSTKQVDNWVVVSSNADRVSLVGNRVRQTTAGGESFVQLHPQNNSADEPEDVYIGFNDIVGDFSAACIDNKVTANDLLIEYNNMDNLNAVDCCISLNGATDGTIRYNTLRIATDGQGTWIISTANTDTQLYQNFGVNKDGETGLVIGTPSI